MKTYYTWCIMLVTAVQAIAQTHKIETTATVKKVTVYQNKALIKSEVVCTLLDGSNTLFIKDLPSALLAQTIQLGGDGNYTVVSVQPQINYLKEIESNPEIKELDDSLKKLNRRLNLKSQLLDVLNQEEKMILANQLVKGENSNLKALDLEDLADFYRERLTEIKTKQLQDKETIATLQQQVNNLTSQLNSKKELLNQPSSEIKTVIQAKGNQTITLQVLYVTNGARWTPLYDIRYQEGNPKLALNYKAQVIQQTGFDWKNVELTLSTANPDANTNKPELYPWYVDFLEPIKYKAKKSYSAERSESMDEAKVYANYSMATDYIEVSENLMFAEYKIKLPYSVASDNNGQLVEIQNFALPANLNYYAAPRLSSQAFVTNMLTGWENLNLLPGSAQVYYNNTFVGENYIGNAVTNDTMYIAMGVDPKIIITREKNKDLSSKSFLGNSKKIDLSYQLKIRNTKKEAIQITIEEQIPLSKNNDITVEIIEKSGGEYNVETGIVKWNVSVQPNETKELKINYTVKHPKNKAITNIY